MSSDPGRLFCATGQRRPGPDIHKLKDNLGAAAAQELAADLARAWPAFPARDFARGVAVALEPLELVARAELFADRLGAALPSRFSEAEAVLRRALESSSFTGWKVWPCGLYVARSGLVEPDRALPLLAALTPRWSSEFAVRPFVERHPDITYDHLCRWCHDEDEHVRRLVSEGTRPRLPWAPLLRGLVTDPAPNLPLLDALVDDPSAYVRRSVANHLNDISKDHPALALSLAEEWSARGGGATWVARHGLRTLVKRGDPTALALIGADTTAQVELITLAVDSPTVGIGDAVSFEFVLRLRDDQPPSEAVIDYRVHYAGARGTKAAKVFKLSRRRLQPGAPVAIRRSHRMESVSIRRIHAGSHRIDVQVNGRVLGSVAFEVVEK